MTFKQSDLKLNRFIYTIEGGGIRIVHKKLFSSQTRFIPFEDVGEEKVIERSRKWIFLVLSILFLVLAAIVFIRRMNGVKTGEGAELFYLGMSAVFLMIDEVTRKNRLLLTTADRQNQIEFIGRTWFGKRPDAFIGKLLQHRNAYLSVKYPEAEGLTAAEQICCNRAGLPLSDGLFLKKISKHQVELLEFGNDSTGTEKPTGISTRTSEKNARKIIADFRDRFIQEGKYLFISEFSGKDFQIGLTGMTNDPYQLMEHAGTNGLNYDVETKDIIEKYRKWSKQFGIKPVGIGFDFCECEIINRDLDYHELAREVYAFCPDTVEQGTASVDELANEIKRTGRIFMWWD